MRDKAPCNLDFFEWLDTLSDEEHHEVFLQLRSAVQELGCVVNQHPLITHHLLQFPPHVPPKSGAILN